MNRPRITALLALALVVTGGTPALADDSPPPSSITVRWAMPTPEGGWTAEPTADTATWPQALASDADCGGWWQEDDYDTSTPEKAAATAALDDDGVLLRGEDDALTLAWRFVQQPACPEPEPEPEPEPSPSPEPTTPAPAPEPSPSVTVPPEDYGQGDDAPPVDELDSRTSAEPAAPPVAELAATGLSENGKKALGAALFLVVIGAVLVLVRPRRTDDEDADS